MEGKTNFLRHLKQFDGFTNDAVPHILQQIYATVSMPVSVNRMAYMQWKIAVPIGCQNCYRNIKF